jgi:HK97 family phage prohead protease
MKPDLHQAGSARSADTAPTILRKSVDCVYKSLDESGSFELYAAVFGNVDRQGDVISVGAFQSLDKFVQDGWGAVNHVNCLLPVAWIETAEQDDHGLRVRGKFHSTPEAQACRTVVTERMKAGKSVKCSIGYLILEDAVETRDKRQIRLLKKLEVFEFSFVNLPANPEAEVIDAKRLEHAATTSKGTSMDENKGSALQALKALLGLDKKAGRAMSAANHKKLTAFADAMSEHHEEGKEKCKCAMKACKGLMDEHKGMMEHHEEGCKIAEELGKCLKSFAPSARDETDADEESDEDSVYRDDKPKRPKGRKEDDETDDKDEKPQDTADGDPPKGRKRKPEDKAATIYREQLKRRSVAGRSTEQCP